MMNNTWSKIAAALMLILCLMTQSAFAEADLTDGTYTAGAPGFGGTVNVTVTIENCAIAAVTAEGANETPAIGGAALSVLCEQVVAAGNAEVDGVTGATLTSNAVKEAIAACLNQAAGVENAVAAAKMAPGTYYAEARGFNHGLTNKVAVTVSETEILSIEILENSGDTCFMLDRVEDTLIPRMIENQSVTVDALTGVTSSSNAVKTAVKVCVEEALAAGGSDASAIANFYGDTVKVSGEDETLTTDVLVVGMGGSGVYAALRASELGANVLAIDKEARYGGTTVFTAEIEAINPPRVKALYNNGEDFCDAEEMYQVWLDYEEGDAKVELVDLFFKTSGESFDWLALDHGIGFDFKPQAGFDEIAIYPVKFQFLPNMPKEGETVASMLYGANKAEIQGYFDSLVKKFEDNGGNYMLETEGYELITDESGKITGVKARNLYTGKEYVIEAKAVILATGGFLGNGEMMEQYLSNEYFPLASSEWRTIGNTANDGKMMQAAIDLGAGTYNIGMPPEVHICGSWGFLDGFDVNLIEGAINYQGTQAMWSVADMPMYMGTAFDSLAVDTTGKRFTNEMALQQLNSWIAGPYFYSVWSSEQIDSIRDAGFKFPQALGCALFMGYQGEIPLNMPIAEAYDVMQAGIDAGWIYKADTIEELAAKINVDPANLAQTVENYNTYCETGVDAEFGKPTDYMTAIGEGPYYAVKMSAYCYSTCGGLDVDTEMRVLNTEGTPIEGLYSIGNDSMGVLFSEKKPYVTFGGAANGWALTSAYICGETVTNYVNALAQ